MILHWPSGLTTRSPGTEVRRGLRGRRSLRLEALEGRTLLASPTHYIVDLTSDTGMGSGTAGDIAYVVKQANANPNPAGSLIYFDPYVFGTPQTITLENTLVLSEAAGPEMIEGTASELVTISGNNALPVLQVDTSVTAELYGLTISGGSATPGAGGIDERGCAHGDRRHHRQRHGPWLCDRRH